MEEKDMKAIRFTHIALIGAIALLAASCEESELTSNDQVYRPVGSKIDFSAATTYENGPATRAEYSGQMFTLTGYTNPIERIDWVANDPIKIAYNGTAYDCKVTGTITPSNEQSTAGIDGNLYWSDTTPHVFYALYPSGGTAAGSLTTAGAVSGSIPASQPVNADNTITVDGLTKFQPNTAQYGYMVAYKSIASTSTESSVKLYFKPAFTTFEFKLKMRTGSPATKVLSAVLSSEDGTTGSDLAGSFGLKIIADPDHTDRASWEDLTVSSGTRSITVAFPEGGADLTTDSFLDFSILALPVDQKGLTLTLNFDGYSKSIKFMDGREEGGPGTWHTFTGAKKYIITNEFVPTNSEYYYTLIEVDSEGARIDPPADLKAGEVLTGHAGHVGDYPVQTRTKLFKSYKTKKNDDTDNTLVDVKIEFAAANDDGTNSENWSTTRPDWLSGYSWTKPDDATPLASWPSQADYTILPIKELHPEATGLDKYETFNEIKEHTAILRAVGRDNSANFSSSNPQDLALYEIDALTGSARSLPKTANCYVVDRKGWYQFPLVYGNAIDWDHSPANNGWNPSSWKDNDRGETAISLYRLPHFQNFVAAPIRSPYILDDVNQVDGINLTVDDIEAVIVWEDTDDPFISPSTVQVVSTPSTNAVYYAEDGTTEKVIPYIKFQVNDKIMQGNAVIAVREKAGDKRILWSWHIWITDLDMGTVFFPQRGGAVTGNDMMLYNLGWCDMRIGRMYSYVPRICYARISQTDAESDAEPLVFKITEQLDPYYTITQSSGTYYQMGRKDPYLPGTSNEGLSWGWVGYFDVDGIPDPNYSNAELTVPPHSSTGSALPRYINKPVYSPEYSVIAGTGTLVHTEATSSQDNMAHVIQHPNMTYTRSVETTIGWLYNNRPWNLWDMYNLVNLQYRGSGGTLLSDWTPIWQYDRIPAKTVYDPCPPGFVVANYAAYSGATEHGSNPNWGPDLSGKRHEDGDTWSPADAITFPDIPLYGDYRYYFNSSAGTKSICFPSHGYRSNGVIGGIFGGIYNLTSQKKGDRYVICLSGWGPTGGGNSRQTGYAVRPIKEHPTPTPPEPGNAYIYPVLPD